MTLNNVLKRFWNFFFTQTPENMATAYDGEDLKIEMETLSVPMRGKRNSAKNSTKNRITKKLSLHRRVNSGEVNPNKIEINQLMGSIQLGLLHVFGKDHSASGRDLLISVTRFL